MPSTQFARGIFAGFGTVENPFQVPNGMEENLRAIDDHIGPYTLLAPIAPAEAYPADAVNGDGQIYTDGTYAIYNGDVWKRYPALRGITFAELDGPAWTNTGAGWRIQRPLPVVDSIDEIRRLDKTRNARAFATGYDEAHDGGGGDYELDKADTTSLDNGFSILVADDGGRWKLAVVGTVSVKQGGAKGSNLGDDTAALANVYAWCASAGVTAFHPNGTYPVSGGLTAACALEFAPNASLSYIGSDNGTLLEITSANLSHGDVRVWGNERNVVALKVSGSGNFFRRLKSGGVTATAAGNVYVTGMVFPGMGNIVDAIEVTDMVNDGYSNGSYPQAFTVQGDQNVFGDVFIDDARSGGVLSEDVTLTIKNMTCRNMADNGFYQLTGNLRLGKLEYQGIEEPIVFKGNADVDSVTIIGTALGVGFQDCGDVRIGELSVRPDTAGNTPRFLWRVRTGSVSCGRINIGRVTGKFKGSTLFSMPASTSGTVEYLNIGGMDVKFLYDASVATSPTAWGDLTAVKGFRWSDTLIEIIDVNNAMNSTTFVVNAPASVTKESFIDRVDFVVYQSDGVTESANGSVHCANFAQTLIEATRVHWRTDIGPYIVNTAASSALYDCVSQAPTAGTWKRGKYFRAAFPALGGPSGWECIAAGTPGTWIVAGQNGVAIGPTSSRPTAATMGVASDSALQGVRYIDSSLGNKSIVRTGTQWIDANGAAV